MCQITYKEKVKVSPFTGHEGPWGWGCKGQRIHSPGTRMRLGWLVIFSAAFAPVLPFCRRMNAPHDQSGHEGMKKNLYLSDTRDRTLAIQARTQAPEICYKNDKFAFEGNKSKFLVFSSQY